MKNRSYLILSAILFCFITIFPQEKTNTKGNFAEPRKGYYDEVILKGIDEFNNPSKSVKKEFKADLSAWDLPKSVSEFKSLWYNEPVSQGRTGTCWSFSTTSFFESEIYRLNKKEVKLSEMFTAYWEYVEKTKKFIKERGNSEFGEGSEANAVTRIWKEYGIVPEEAYTGMLPGQKFHDHKKMFDEIKSCLQNLKSTNMWDEDEAVQTVKSIMNHYISEPPKEFTVEGKKYTPKEYLVQFLKLNVDDYVNILSYMQHPYYEQVEYEVPDNWWHSKDYYNVPLDDFMSALKNAIRNGYTMAIGGDVSEAGYDSWNDAAIVPSFDIPSEYIDENARQFRFSNGTTTDDHGIHLVGYMQKNGKDWYLIKDSGSSSRNGNNKGYYFYHEDYIKLKIMDFMVHKDAVKDLLSRFNK